MVSFVLLKEFNDGRNICKKFTKFQLWSVLLGYEILMTVGFVPLFLNEFSKTVGFVLLREFNDGRNLWKKFAPLRDFKGSCFYPLQDFEDGRLCFGMRFQWWFVWFSYEISVTVGFVPLFRYKISKTVGWVMRFQRWSVLFCYKSLMMVEISATNLRNINDGRFCSVMRSQWWSAW